MTTSYVHEKALSRLSAVDRLVFSPNAFKTNNEEQLALQVDLVRAAVEHHIEQCELYRDYARRVGFDPVDIESPDDLARVPQIPTGVFKRTTVRSMLDNDMRKCTSSGTRGSLSTIWRDRETIQRLCGSIQSAIAEFLGDPYEDDVVVVNLGPSQEEAGDLWLAYVLSLVELGYETRHMMKEGVLDPRHAAEVINAARQEATTVVVLGAPSVMHEVARASSCNRRDDTDGVRIVAITAGGWKRRSGPNVDRDAFSRTVVDAFGINDPRDVRDTFNQVELNSVVFECECAKKHVPPWLHVFTRDTRTLQREPYGEVGLLAYLDPTAQSYPAFIISDDLGMVDNKRCECGRPGMTLSLVRRVERNEHWGCALKVDDLMHGARAAASKGRSDGWDAPGS